MGRIKSRAARAALGVVAGTLAYGVVASAPAVQDQVGPGPDEGLRSAGVHANVYLHDSFEAEELINKAIRQAGAGRWTQAAQNVRRAVAQHADKLTRIGPGGYTSVPARLNRLVASWPAEGLAAYRRLVEPEAGRMLNQAQRNRRPESLLAVAERYFCTRAGAEAVELAAELALESGDFTRAAAGYRRLLDEHPDRAELRGAATARLAIVHALWGQADIAGQLAREAGPAAVVEWMGQRQALTPLIETLISEVRPEPEPTGVFCWPTFAGSPRRDGCVDLLVDRLAVLWEAENIGPGASLLGEDESGSYRRALHQGRLLSMNPVWAAGTLYLQDSRRVWALQPGDGKLLWCFTGFGEEAGPSFAADSELPQWHGLTVEGSRLYACLGSEAVPYYGYEAPHSSSSLVCLDAATGERLWRTDRIALGADSGEMSLESTPIVAGNKLYVVGRRKRAFGFEDCFLYRLDAVTGEIEFRTHLGSASTGGFGYRRPTLTIPSLYGDTVYVVTNLGTVAAVDRYTGSVRWLRLYERISEAQWRREGRGASRTLRPWQYNPLICTAEHLYALPTDSESLLTLDRATGRIIHEVPIAELHLIQTLLGVGGTRIYGVGDQAFCYDLESGACPWRAALPEDGELLGRGTLTGAQLLVPTRTSLCAFDRATGACTVQAWERPEGGGNLLATPDRLIVAGHDRVTAYARKGDVLSRLRHRSRGRPSDPVPALDLAEVLFRAGDTDESLSALDEAVARAGGFVQPIEPGLKRRIFDDCIGFAQKLAEGSDPPAAVIESLYQQASQCPPDTQAHLVYRFRWAGHYEAVGRWRDAVGLYQQILGDRSLCLTDFADGGGQPSGAGLLAESAVGRLIAEHGRQVYTRFDAQAAQWLEAGRTSVNLELLARLLDSLPNSLAAPEAWQVRAELLSRQGRFVEAAQNLTTALTQYRSQIAPAAVMRGIADCYRQAGRPENAWRWLTKAAREYPTATINVQGRKMSLLEYRAQLGDLDRRAQAPRPMTDPPLTCTYRRDFDAPCHLLDPLFPEVPEADWRHYLVYSAGVLRAFNAQSDEPVWPEAADCPVRPDLLLASTEQVVLATQYRVFSLEADSGRPRWEYGRRPAALDNPGADPEDFAVFVSMALADRLLVALRSDGTAVALQVESGRPKWEHHLDHRPAGPVGMNDTWIVYQTARLGQPACAVLAAADGKPVQVIRPEDDRQVTHIFVTLDGRVVLVTSETVQCHDVATGQRVWSVQRPQGIMAGGVAPDLDGLCLADANLQTEKLELASGRTVWRADSPGERVRPGAEGIAFHLCDGQLVVATERRVFALSQRDGRVLWEGTVRRGTRFRRHLMTDSFLVAVDSPPEHFGEPRAAFFYDLRNASGLIPTDGGVLTLGTFEDVKRVTVRDGALLLQDSRTIHAWTTEP